MIEMTEDSTVAQSCQSDMLPPWNEVPNHSTMYYWVGVNH